MKIAYIVSNWKMPVVGPSGPAVHIQEVCRGLVEMGHQVFIVAASGDGEAPREAGAGRAAVQVRVLGTPLPGRTRGAEKALSGLSGRSSSRLHSQVGTSDTTWAPAVVAADLVRWAGDSAWHRSFYRRALAIVSEERPDALYERYERASTVGVRLARKLSLPLVLEMNNSLTFVEQWRHRHSPLYLRWARTTEREICLRADRVLMVSPSLRRYLLDLGVPASRIELVTCGAEPTRYAGLERRAEAIRGRFGLHGKTVVGFVGSFKRWIDLDLLLDSAKSIAASRDDFHFLLVGDGEQRRKLEARVRAEGLAETVTFTGEVSRDEVPAHIVAMDIATAPYPDLPSFDFLPLKLFEYMAAGKPVVVTRNMATEQLVTEAHNGLLAEPGDVAGFTRALLELHGDAALRERLGAAARCTVEQEYTWERQVARIENLLLDALAERGG